MTCLHAIPPTKPQVLPSWMSAIRIGPWHVRLAHFSARSPSSKQTGTSLFTGRWQRKGKQIMTINPPLNRRREGNLRAIRSPASILLAVVAAAAMIVATVFYDRPITDNPVVLSYLRGLSTNTVQ